MSMKKAGSFIQVETKELVSVQFYKEVRLRTKLHLRELLLGIGKYLFSS